jgi:hypothetical protein
VSCRAGQVLTAEARGARRCAERFGYCIFGGLQAKETGRFPGRCFAGAMRAETSAPRTNAECGKAHRPAGGPLRGRRTRRKAWFAAPLWAQAAQADIRTGPAAGYVIMEQSP